MQKQYKHLQLWAWYLQKGKQSSACDKKRMHFRYRTCLKSFTVYVRLDMAHDSSWEMPKFTCFAAKSSWWQHFGSIFTQILFQPNRASRMGTAASAHLEFPCQRFSHRHHTSTDWLVGLVAHKHHCAWTDQCPICPQSAASVREQGGFGSTTSRYTCSTFDISWYSEFQNFLSGGNQFGWSSCHRLTLASATCAAAARQHRDISAAKVAWSSKLPMQASAELVLNQLCWNKMFEKQHLVAFYIYLCCFINFHHNDMIECNDVVFLSCFKSSSLGVDDCWYTLQPNPGRLLASFPSDTNRLGRSEQNTNGHLWTLWVQWDTMSAMTINELKWPKYMSLTSKYCQTPTL